MSEGLDRLRSIGAQKIHEDTHISLSNVEAILEQNFEKIQKVQFLGFISILEREYKVDLSSLKKDAKEYFATMEEATPHREYIQEESLTLPVKHKVLIVLLVILLVVMIGGFYFSSSQKNGSEQIDSSVAFGEQNKTKENVVLVQTPPKEENLTASKVVFHEEASQKDKVILEKKEKEKSKLREERKVLPYTLEIIPKTKVWFGYIDLSDYKKRQTVTKKPVELNASKNYLLTFGHGYIDIKVGDKIKSFKKSKSIKFIYENGRLKEITKDEFKARNKGKIW